MATTNKAVIKGITYERGKDNAKFICQVAVRGTRDSEGHGTTIQLTEGATYEFVSYATSTDVTITNPYLIKDSIGNQIGWFKEDIFPEGTYTVTYNANGGLNAPSPQTKIHDVDLVLTSEVPTKTGYTFGGWGITPIEESTGDYYKIDYYAGDVYSNNESITLYAVWEVSETQGTTNTFLYVSGSSTNPSSKNVTVYPYSSNNDIYWKIANLQSPLSSYEGFYLFRSNNFKSVFPGFRNVENNGVLISDATINPLVTVKPSDFPNTTDKFIKRSDFTYPSENCKICKRNGDSNPYFAMAQTSQLWKVGNDPDDEDAAQIAYVNLPHDKWIRDAFKVTVQTVGSTTATLKWVWRNGKNKNGYISRALADSGSKFTTGSTISNYKYGRTDELGEDISSFTHKISGLSAGSTNKVYLSVQLASDTYSEYGSIYYGIHNTDGKDYIEFTTDAASYAAEKISVDDITSTSATVNISGLSPTTNLDNGIYASPVNVSSSSNISNIGVMANVSLGDRNGNSGTVTIKGLKPGKSNMRYIYVYSTVSKMYYQIGSVNINTAAYVYYGIEDGKIIPCHAYMLNVDNNQLEPVIMNAPEYIPKT